MDNTGVLSPFVNGMKFEITKEAQVIKDDVKLMGFKFLCSYGTYRVNDGRDDLIEIDGCNCYLLVSALHWMGRVNHLLEKLGCPHKIIKNNRKHFIQYGEYYE